MTKRIPVPTSLVALLVYDAETGYLFWRPEAMYGKRRQRADNLDGHREYRRVYHEGRHYSAHRLAWLLTHGEWPEYLDHANGDTADNRIANLRAATASQNSMNRRPRSGKVFPKGVAKLRNGTFQAQIFAGGKSFYLGVYTTPEEASEAYAAAASQKHGSFGRTA